MVWMIARSGDGACELADCALADCAFVLVLVAGEQAAKAAEALNKPTPFRNVRLEMETRRLLSDMSVLAFAGAALGHSRIRAVLARLHVT